MTADLRPALRQLVATQRTLVLATADPEPWSAPVYYVQHDDRLCFFSSPGSRHAAAALAAGRCAGAIFREGDDWRDIEGVQMEGRLEPVPLGPRSGAILTAYVAKFPTVRSLFPESDAEAAIDPLRFLERFRAALYAFLPDQVHYLNNRLGFGARQVVQWPP